MPTDLGGMQTIGTPCIAHSRLFTAQRTVSAFAAAVAASHNWALDTRRNPAESLAESAGWAIVPVARSNYAVFDFFGVGSGSFSARFWKFRWDESCGRFTRRIFSETTLTLGTVTCPTPVADQSSSLWVDAITETVIHSALPVPTVITPYVAGVPANYLIQTEGAEYVGVEMAQNSGSATLFNGRYYLL